MKSQVNALTSKNMMDSLGFKNDYEAQSYMAHTLKHPLYLIKWRRIILDEAHYIKNHNCESARACRLLDAQRRWCITGTVSSPHPCHGSACRCQRLRGSPDVCFWAAAADSEQRGRLARALHVLEIRESAQHLFLCLSLRCRDTNCCGITFAAVAIALLNLYIHTVHVFHMDWLPPNWPNLPQTCGRGRSPRSPRPRSSTR